ncbi:MFS transporter [Corynebacterium pyruviciproducens]|uniref:MFS transporter n=1 Tax=Corynebacterium pyruviciproducens TaxID=598660 RepID=UPI002889A4B3|nr:MFS transporter [Corynebacterium pyruviciproducens]
MPTKVAGATPYIYLASAATSILGNAVASIVWPWMVLEKTGNPAAAGIVATCITVPSLIFAFLGGHLVDTVGKKPMSIVSDIVSGLSIVFVILADHLFGLSLGWFIALGIFGAVGDVPGMSARSALIGDVVTEKMTLDRLSGINQTISSLGFLVGPAVAGVLLSTLAMSDVLWITAVCSFTAAVFTCFLPVGSAPAATKGEGLLESVSSWKRVLEAPSIRLIAIVSLASTVCVAPLISVLLPAHFQAIDRPGLLGITMSCYAVGQFVGGAFIAWRGTTRRRWVWVVATSFEIVGMAFFVAVQLNWTPIVGMILAGIGGGLFGPLIMVLVTQTVPNEIRGRAFSLFNAIGLFASPIGLIIVTGLLQALDIYQVCIVLSVAFLGVGTWGATRGWAVLPDRADS